MSKKEEQAMEYWGRIEDWMLWEGWETDVGCERCVEGGEDAPCWGVTSCHGYYWGCGCKDCTERERDEEFLRRKEVRKMGMFWREPYEQEILMLMEVVACDCGCRDLMVRVMKKAKEKGREITASRWVGMAYLHKHEGCKEFRRWAERMLSEEN